MNELQRKAALLVADHGAPAALMAIRQVIITAAEGWHESAESYDEGDVHAELDEIQAGRLELLAGNINVAVQAYQRAQRMGVERAE